MAIGSRRSYINEASWAHRRLVCRATVVNEKVGGECWVSGPVLAEPGSGPQRCWGHVSACLARWGGVKTSYRNKQDN